MFADKLIKQLQEGEKIGVILDISLKDPKVICFQVNTADQSKIIKIIEYIQHITEPYFLKADSDTYIDNVGRQTTIVGIHFSEIYKEQQPIQFKTRYGMVTNPFVSGPAANSNIWYRKVSVQNLL